MQHFSFVFFFFFFFKQKTAYEMLRSLVGSEMCIRDSSKGVITCTSGSWVWGTTELPNGAEGTLFLVDTQGLASGNQEGLNRLFTFSVLLSNVLVLNVLRQVNDDTLNKLGAVSALSRLVQGSVDVFPELLTLVRDFDLDITEDGFADNNEYLEDLLKPDGSTERDATRASIKSIFAKRSLISMEAPTKSEKAFLNSWNGDGDDAEPGLPPAGDFVESFEKSAELILEAALANPKRLGDTMLDGAMLADLAEEIVNNINEKPVDLHDALHSIFDGVCRRAAESARDQITASIEQVKSKLPMSTEELEAELRGIRMMASSNYDVKVKESGVPDGDPTVTTHMDDLERVLADKWDFITNENEKVILEIIQDKANEFETRLRETVDEIDMEDLGNYCTEHDEVQKQMAEEFGQAISFASQAMREKAMDKFISSSIDLRRRNLERARLKQIAEEQKRQKLMLMGAGILIVVAVGIDGDPFDELWALLQILWFLPILMVGMGVYVAMYQKLPPGTMEVYTTVQAYAGSIKEQVAAKPKESKEKPE
eukprot:TRINITY_DN125_c0_g1_i16.p1 TRINITY_DN125_c0_g1~~TRINITY_DN125_c0_g1_i16.p1  ORF type:complete len:540 (+),score=225.92 TRINITY_DN125_c0_g1_i16:64-1683(+)